MTNIKVLCLTVILHLYLINLLMVNLNRRLAKIV